MKIKDIIDEIENFAPVSLQEHWDNSGLIIGNRDTEISSAVITLDVTEAVIDDAILKGDQLIISHHPLILSGIKKINGATETDRVIIKAIQNNIAIYSAHTNIDVVPDGVSWRMAQKLGLQNIKTLVPQKGLLKKLIVYVPVSYAEKVRNAMFDAGAGQIGNYSSCSFNTTGQGTFKANEGSNPFSGEIGILHFEEEVKVETILPSHLQSAVISEMIKAHPYEEVAYDIVSLENVNEKIGLGIIGELSIETTTVEFLNAVKYCFCCRAIRHTPIVKDNVRKIAMIGGAGSAFLKDAINAGADVFVTGDFKYHQFFEAENRIVIADIGHYESEQFTKELFYEIVTNKFSKFAIRLSEVQTNPVKYLF